jgi:hypothetical protein
MFNEQKESGSLISTLDNNVPDIISSNNRPRNKTTSPDRLLVVETTYHQKEGKQTKSIENKTQRELLKKDDLFQRTLTVGEEFEKINLGWIEHPGTLLIKNEQKIYIDVIPTLEEKEARMLKKLLVKFSDSEHGFLIHPEDQLRIEPTNHQNLLIKSMSGTTEYTLTVISE